MTREKLIARAGLLLTAALLLVPTQFVHVTPRSGDLWLEAGQETTLFLLIAEIVVITTMIGAAVAACFAGLYGLYWCWIHK